MENNASDTTSKGIYIRMLSDLHGNPTFVKGCPLNLVNVEVYMYIELIPLSIYKMTFLLIHFFNIRSTNSNAVSIMTTCCAQHIMLLASHKRFWRSWPKPSRTHQTQTSKSLDLTFLMEV